MTRLAAQSGHHLVAQTCPSAFLGCMVTTEDTWGRKPDAKSACYRKRTIGRYCGRASCSTECHSIYMLRVREFLTLVLKQWPDYRPTLFVRVRLKGASTSKYLRFRREFTRRLSRRKIEYALVSHLLEENVHDHGFVRHGTRDQVLAAMKGAARKIGYELTTDDFAVTTFKNLNGVITYTTKMEKVYDAAPRRWRVFTASYGFAPVGFRDGGRIAFKRKLKDPGKIHPKMMQGLQAHIEKRYALCERRRGVRPASTVRG